MRYLVLALLVTLAPDYPEPGRKLRHIVPWGAGGATDAAMRGFMPYLATRLGIPIVTENIPGGLSAVGLLQLKAARPDGYTIGTLTYDVLTLSFQGLAPISYKDFEPIGMVTEHPSVLVVAADRFEDVDAFRRAASSHAGKIKVGNVGTGGIWHQHAVAMEAALGVTLSHIPYEAGSAAQLTALLGGEVDATVSSLPAPLPYVREGKLRVLAVMAAERDPLVPEVPTFQELGIDLVYGGFRVLAVPRGTPKAIRSKLEAAVASAFEEPAFRTWAHQAVIGARYRNAAETAVYLDETAGKVEALMKALGLAP